MDQMAKLNLRVDQAATMKSPHVEAGPDSKDCVTQFKYDYALSCAAEARTLPTGSQGRSEYFQEAITFFDAALERSPNNPQFHFSRGLVSAEKGDITSALNGFRNAIMYNPSEAHQYIMALQVGSEEANKRSPGTVSLTTLKIQSQIAEGSYGAAFSSAHADINICLARDTEPNLWNVQLMRIAAMQIGEERTYVNTLHLLEAKGVLNAHDPEYHPVGYRLTAEMRKNMLDEALVSGGEPARSKIWIDMETHDVTPINGTAVNVGPKAAKG